MLIKTFKQSPLFILTIAFALIAASCGQASTNIASTKVHTVGSQSKFQQLVASAMQERQYAPGISEDAVAEPGVPEQGEDSEGGRDFVDTNVQVDGVDEGDIVKTDGYDIFYAPRYQNRVHVFDVDDAGGIAYQEGIDLATVYVDSLYLTQQYLIVVGYTFNNTPSCGIEWGDDYICYEWMWWSPTGTVQVFDRDDLSLVYALETNTNFLDHRLVDDSLFLVGHQNVYATNDDYRPSYTIGEQEPVYLDYDSIYYFDETPAVGMSVVTGIKLEEDSEQITFNASAYLGSAYGYKQIYVSTTDLYISDTNYIYEREASYQTMTIAQFSLDKEGAQVTFVAAGTIKGGMLNQFSMDYHAGYLRVATTSNGATWRRGNDDWEWFDYERNVSNHLYVLKLNDAGDGFIIISHLSEGLGKPLESIKSVRFLDNRAYIVTFLQTDPLYIIDLSDPRKPVITDEIHLPGFDTYQHPWGPNNLLGIGYDADENGLVQGMKLTAYNTTSGGAMEMQTERLSNEIENNTNTWSYSYSEALFNHKALLVSVDHGVFGFPVEAYEYGYTEEGPADQDWYYHYHSYYYLYHIDFTQSQPISQAIKIEHTMSDNYYVGVDRAVMIENFVYTLSDHQVVTYHLVEQRVMEEVLNIPTL